MKKIFVSLLLCFSAQFLFACSCMGTAEVKDAIKTADALFIGEVIKVDTITKSIDFDFNYYHKKVTFRILKRYKGKKKYETIEITTGMGGGDCGIRFKLNEQYIVYAYKEKNYFGEQKKARKCFETNICTRTTGFTTMEIEEIEKVKKRFARRKMKS